MASNYYQYIKKLIVILLVLSIGASYIISHNSFHLDYCEDEHCIICNTINAAKSVIQCILGAILIYNITICIIYILAKLINHNTNVFTHTLVNLNVQLNE